MGVCGCKDRAPQPESADEKLKLKMLVNYIQNLAEAKNKPVEYKIYRANINRNHLEDDTSDAPDLSDYFTRQPVRQLRDQEYVAGGADSGRIYSRYSDVASHETYRDDDFEVASNEELEPMENSLFNPMESLQYRELSRNKHF